MSVVLRGAGDDRASSPLLGLVVHGRFYSRLVYIQREDKTTKGGGGGGSRAGIDHLAWMMCKISAPVSANNSVVRKIIQFTQPHLRWGAGGGEEKRICSDDLPLADVCVRVK